MNLLSQEAKAKMERCKQRAEAAGLQIRGETLEYIVTNRDMIGLGAKYYIPTLYNFWPQEVQVVRDEWVYDAWPHNPYETVINTRPGISFYNGNNPDWLNAMIFYHVLAHLDFFQNNIRFRNTWSDDFCGQALSDNRLLERIREEQGAKKRWVDYVLEFAVGLDNLVGYYEELREADRQEQHNLAGVISDKSNFYFGDFLNRLYDKRGIDLNFYFREVERYNASMREFGETRGEIDFFEQEAFKSRFPEFNNVFKEYKKKKKPKPKDILQHLMENSAFINDAKNQWMRDVIGIVRRTSLYFQAQIRTKICNEGWASLWHERLFIPDESIKTHEIGYSTVNAGVLVDERVGLNPYIIGMRLFKFIEEMAGRGKLSYGFQMLNDLETRKRYNEGLGEEYGKQVLFNARKYLDDYMLVNFLSEKDFQDFVDRYDLFVAGFRPSKKRRGFAEVYIKSRSGEDYREVLKRQLYHPPNVIINETKGTEEELYLDHIYEGRQLVTRYIRPVLIGLAYLAGKRVKLETTEFEAEQSGRRGFNDPGETPKYKKVRVLYTCVNKDKFERVILDEGSDYNAY